MPIDKNTVQKIARLAQIEIAPEEVDSLTQDLSKILSFMEQLNSADITDISPMTSVTPMNLEMRADEITDGNYPEKILRNAPEHSEGFFAVPKVIE